MDIVEPVEKAAALHVDGAESVKNDVDGDIRTNSTDSLKRRLSHEVEKQVGSEPKKLKTSNNGETTLEKIVEKIPEKAAEKDDADDLIAKLEAINDTKVNKEMSKPADVLKKLEEDGKSDDLLERMECIVEGKTPPTNSRPATDTEDNLLANLEEVTKESPVAEKKEPTSVTPQKEEVKETTSVKKPDELKKEEIKKAEEPKKEDSPKKVVVAVASPSKPADENATSSAKEAPAKESQQQSNIPIVKTPEKKTSVLSSAADSSTLSDGKSKEEEKTKTPEKSASPTKEEKGEKKDPAQGDASPAVSASSSSSVEKSSSDSSKHNGIIASSGPATSSKTEDVKEDQSMEVDSVVANGKTAAAVVVPESEYEVKFCFEDNDIKYLHVEKKDAKESALPGSSAEKKLDDANSPDNSHQQVKTFKGISSVRSFMMELLKKITPEEDEDEVKSKKGGKGQSSKSQKASPAVKTPVTTASGRKSIPKASPAAAATPVKASPSGGKDSKVGFSVMARWVDKMYYAGRVLEEKSGGKYQILFEDGASKTLNSDVIIFGRGSLMPFYNQFVHALVEEDTDTYEPGIVTLVEVDQHDRYWYTVVTESKTVTRMATGIYLEDDQAKTIQAAIKKDPNTGLVDLESVQLVNRATPTPSESSETSSTAGRKRGRKSDPKGGQQAEAEPGFSGGGDAKKSRRGKRLEPPSPSVNLNESLSSDISDIPDIETAAQSPESPAALEAIDGVQPEMQKTAKEIDRIRRWYFDECLKNGKSLDDLLGPIPTVKNLFKNKSFILTVTFESKSVKVSADSDDDEPHPLISEARRVPFFKDHLQKQIEAGGGKVFQHWEDVPKNKYTNCKLITPFPCTTAKYVQCLATGINAVSHLWIIDSCRDGKIADIKEYILPTGWSIIEKRYINPTVKRISSNSKALADLNVLLTSESKEFTEFWSRVCKLAGAASVQTVKTQKDISTTEKGFLLVGGEVSPVMIEKAKDFNISVVSTVWVVQSLISGIYCPADAHESLSTLFPDEC